MNTTPILAALTALSALSAFALGALAPGALPAQPPEPLITNRGAIWAGEGPMIVLSRAPDGMGIDCFALKPSSVNPQLIAQIHTPNLVTGTPRSVKLEIDEPTQVIWWDFGSVFDVSAEALYLPGITSPVYFSYEPPKRKLVRIPYNSANKSLEIREVDTLTGFEFLRNSIPLASFPGLPNTNSYSGPILLAPDILALTALEGGDFGIVAEDVVTIDISGETPVLSYIREGILPIFPEGIDGNILRFRDGFSAVEMTWMDVITGEITRIVNVGVRWVSHSVNPDTGAYYFHNVERVVEDPVGSGVYYTEIPVVVFEDDFTTQSEVAFRIAYPAEPPSPQDYLDHLLEKKEPLPGSPFPARKRVSPVIFKDPDRNGDARIDVADYIRRLNELEAK